MTKTILIAAESPGTIYLLRRYAEESGYATVQVDHDEDVLDIAAHVHPAVILLEVELPKSVGWKTFGRLTADEATRGIPIVVCSWAEEASGEAPPELVEKAAGYLQKPVLYGDFLATLGELGVA